MLVIANSMDPETEDAKWNSVVTRVIIYPVLFQLSSSDVSFGPKIGAAPVIRKSIWKNVSVLY